MIALPQGVSVYAGGRTWVGQIPEELCPEHLKPAPPAAKGKGAQQPAAEPNEAPGG